MAVQPVSFLRANACPRRIEARRLGRLLIAHGFRRRLEIVHLRAVAARVQTDPDKVVETETDIVRRLLRDDRHAGLLGAKSDVEIVLVV